MIKDRSCTPSSWVLLARAWNRQLPSPVIFSSANLPRKCSCRLCSIFGRLRFRFGGCGGGFGVSGGSGLVQGAFSYERFGCGPASMLGPSSGWRGESWFAPPRHAAAAAVARSAWHRSSGGASAAVLGTIYVIRWFKRCTDTHRHTHLREHT